MMGNLDADSGVESFALYAELAKSHKWLDKVTYFVGMHRIFISGIQFGNDNLNIRLSERPDIWPDVPDMLLGTVLFINRNQKLSSTKKTTFNFFPKKAQSKGKPEIRPNMKLEFLTKARNFLLPSAKKVKMQLSIM